MKSIFSVFGIAAAIVSVQTVSSNEAVCHRCEEVREYNAAHHKNYEYFEDYAKSDDFDKDDDNPFLQKQEPAATAGVSNPKPKAPVAERSTKSSTPEKNVPSTSTTPSAWKTSPQKN